MLVDSHCHLNYKPLNEDCDGAVARARQAGVVRMLCIGTTLREFPQVQEATVPYEDVYCTVGVHPSHSHEDGETVTAEQLIKLTQNPKVVGIGETGLDYYYKHADAARQRESFREHIRACIATDLPMIVHSRDAETDTAQIIREERVGKEDRLRGVLHCFSSKRILAEEAVAMGFYVSLSGILTFKKSQELRDIACDVPMDRLLVETDSPYLAPEPFRGRPCEPAYVVHTAKVLAEVKGVSMAEIEARTTENFFRLFNKVPPP